MNGVQVYVPATVANIGSGFDIMGFAIEAPGDVLEIRHRPDHQIKIHNKSGHSLPTALEHNCTSVAVQSLFGAVNHQGGVDLIIKKKIPPGSGLGSSAAGAVAGVVAANALLGSPLSTKELLTHALAGEFVASGARHADNVAPALLGGVLLIRSLEPLDIVQLNSPTNLFGTVLLPQLKVCTKEARAILPREVSLSKAVQQWGNVAGLVAGFAKSDMNLIARSMEDVIVEPARSKLIPGYAELKEAALQAGALSFAISGAGPAMYALCTAPSKARKVGNALKAVCRGQGLQFQVFAGQINQGGPKVLSGLSPTSYSPN